MSSFGSRLRRQLRQSGRRLEGLGRLRLRVVRGGPELPAALDAVLALEASGWKTRAGTAVLSNPRLERLYRGFAARAGEEGRLRLHLLELDGRPVVGSFGCVVGNVAHLMKTGYDERLAEHSPGTYLLGEILRLSVEEGLSGCDLLGAPDPFKMRFADRVRPRIGLRAYRGPRSLPESLYWTHGRPALKWLAVRTVRRPAVG
jgi:CelD/BcsL family acetyltransferase involved in cellulose biosynthesis